MTEFKYLSEKEQKSVILYKYDLLREKCIKLKEINLILRVENYFLK